jgi:hypothetical protein
LCPIATFSAKLGLEPNVLNALIEVSSMLMEFAPQLVLNATPSTRLQETA